MFFKVSLHESHAWSETISPLFVVSGRPLGHRKAAQLPCEWGRIFHETADESLNFNFWHLTWFTWRNWINYHYHLGQLCRFPECSYQFIYPKETSSVVVEVKRAGDTETISQWRFKMSKEQGDGRRRYAYAQNTETLPFVAVWNLISNNHELIPFIEIQAKESISEQESIPMSLKIFTFLELTHPYSHRVTAFSRNLTHLFQTLHTSPQSNQNRHRRSRALTQITKGQEMKQNTCLQSSWAVAFFYPRSHDVCVQNWWLGDFNSVLWLAKSAIFHEEDEVRPSRGGDKGEGEMK